MTLPVTDPGLDGPTKIPPPPNAVEETLLTTRELFIVREPVLLMNTPPPWLADVFPAMVVLLMVAEEAVMTAIPPPNGVPPPLTTLRRTNVFDVDRLALLTRMPPPWFCARLLSTTESAIDRVPGRPTSPVTTMPPPVRLTLPRTSVRVITTMLDGRTVPPTCVEEAPMPPPMPPSLRPVALLSVITESTRS